jgi:hypothetical protein
MKKMLRFEVIDYGFKNRPQTDERLQVEGDVFNDFHYGSGFSRREALQSAVELIEEQGINPHEDLLEELDSASKVEQNDETYYLAIRFFYNRKDEEAEFDENLREAMNDARVRRAAEAAENGEDAELMEV